uniref:Uncharacterized protein n=1 Tax=Cacopsylla melanoneura TaxID=428564 RepID=A0A8D9DZS0_9HEMI
MSHMLPPHPQPLPGKRNVISFIQARALNTKTSRLTSIVKAIKVWMEEDPASCGRIRALHHPRQGQLRLKANWRGGFQYEEDLSTTLITPTLRPRCRLYLRWKRKPTSAVGDFCPPPYLPLPPISALRS